MNYDIYILNKSKAFCRLAFNFSIPSYVESGGSIEGVYYEIVILLLS